MRADKAYSLAVLVITLVFTVLCFFVGFEIDVGVSPADVDVPVTIPIALGLYFIFGAVLAWLSKHLYDLYRIETTEYAKMSIIFAMQFFLYLSLTLLVLGFSILIIIVYGNTGLFIEGVGIYPYPILVAIASLLSMSAALMYFFYQSVVFRGEIYAPGFVGYVAFLVVTDAFIVHPLNYYGRLYQPMNFVKVFSRVLMLAMYLIPIAMVLVRSYRKIKRAEDPKTVARFKLLIVGNLSFVMYFVFYVVDALMIKPFTVYMVLAWIFGAAGLLIIYLSITFPEWVERFLIKHL